MRSMCTKTLTALSLIAICFVFVWPAQAAEFEVTNVGKLLDALKEAKGNGEDDIIKLQQGTYVGNFVYDSEEANALTLEGGYEPDFASRTIDPANTVLDGNQAGIVMAVSTDQATPVTIEGLTFQNGVTLNPRKDCGGGLYYNSSGGRLQISHSAFTGNSAFSKGGGVYAYTQSGGLTVTLNNNTFTGNSASPNGGGLYADAQSGGLTVTLNNNTFTGNSARNGAGLYADAHSDGLTVTLNNNTFTGNFASSDGGGLYAIAYECRLTLNNSTFSRNSAKHGGGLYPYAHSGALTLNNSTFTRNSASLNGGGVYAYAYRSGALTVTLNNSTFSGNSAKHGGGLYADAHSGALTLTNNTFTGNSASSDGGGLYADAYDGAVTPTNNTFYANAATDKGGGHLGVYLS